MASKFSPSDSPLDINVTLIDEAAVFRVRDRGPGIPASKIGSVFKRFEQADASDSRAAGGTGLGLAITRMIVELHGGRISVDSRVGEGSTFSFTVPLALSAC